jgi:DNA-binding SARP family transcriptional activator
MEFRLLGPLEVESDGRAITIGPAKERALLALLLLARGRPVATGRLIDALWADDPPETAAKSVQVYVAHLRKALGTERIRTRERGYELALEPGETDVERFEQHVGRARASASPRETLAELSAALDLVRGPVLADLLLEPWAAPEAGRLEERILDAREQRIDAELSLGRHRAVVPELETLVGENPFRERLLEQLMLALYRSGRQADALAAYRKGADRLRGELGLEPGRPLQELESRMLRQDPTLDVAPAHAIEARRRSWTLITAGALALVVGAAAALALLLWRDDATALASIPPGVALIDAGTGRLVAHIPGSEIAEPVEAVTGSGSFWVWNLSPFSLDEVNPRSGDVVMRIASPFGGDAGWFLPDGKDVWFTGPGELVRVDAREGRAVERYPLERAAAGRFGFTWLARCAGSMWVVDADAGAVLRVDPVTGRERTRIAVQYPWAIACGDGGLWVTSNFAGLSRIDPARNEVVATAPIETHLDAVAVAGGYAWTTDEQRGTLYKVDRQGRIAATYETGDGARQVSFAGGRMWVANQDVGTVTGVDVVTGDVQTYRFGHPVQAVAALGDRLLVELNPGRTYEDRIEALEGAVAKLIVPIYVFDPPDPALAWNPWSFMIERATCSTLLAFADPAHSDSALRPDLALAMPRVSNGGKTYTFTVRTGRRFAPPSNARVTAESVRTSIERALSPKLASDSPGARFMSDLVGATRYHDGRAAHVSGIRVRGHTISFTLTEPNSYFLSRLSLPFFCTVPPETPTLEGGVPGVAPPSAAPYYMSERFNGEYMILKRNPNYQGPTPARLDAIAFREGLAPEKAVARVKSGDWDGALLDDTLLGPDSAAARQARRGGTLRYKYLADVTNPDPNPSVYALLSSRLGCDRSADGFDLAALCLQSN